jgi:hypothetical protein
MERPSFPSQPASTYTSTSSTGSSSAPPPRRETASAPIPSPTIQQSHYFGSFAPQAPSYEAQSQQQQSPYPYQQAPSPYQQTPHYQQAPHYQLPQQQSSYPTQQSYGQEQQQQQDQSIRPTHYQYDPNRTGAGATAQETSGFIRDYALVAEAAKRAQMAVLMRDMGDVEIR